MLTGLHKYLVERGYKRTCSKLVNGKWVEVEDYDSMFVSTYGPDFYYYKKGYILFTYGLLLHKVRPFLILENRDKLVITGASNDNGLAKENGFMIFFDWLQEKDYEKFLDAIESGDKTVYFNTFTNAMKVVDNEQYTQKDYR
jgi:hypothetical protein